MEKIAETHAARTVKIRHVKNVTDNASLIVKMDIMVKSVKEVMNYLYKIIDYDTVTIDFF